MAINANLIDWDNFKLYKHTLESGDFIPVLVWPYHGTLKASGDYAYITTPTTIKDRYIALLNKLNVICCTSGNYPFRGYSDIIRFTGSWSAGGGSGPVVEASYEGYTLKTQPQLTSGAGMFIIYMLEDEQGNLATNYAHFGSLEGEEAINPQLETYILPPSEYKKGSLGANVTFTWQAIQHLEFRTQSNATNFQKEVNLLRAILNKSKLYDPDDTDDGETSSGGGGGGTANPGGDTNEDDGVPTLSAVDCGLLTVFNPSINEVRALGRFLWSDSFDINAFKKLLQDPFDALLGFQIIPVKPEVSASSNIIFGNIDTGVSAPIVNSQWLPVDMGTLDLQEIYNSALDFEPTTAVGIYLPFIGYRSLNTVDVMSSSLHLIYKFDILTGTCIAQLYVNHQYRNNTSGDFNKWTKNQGFMYSFEGQCSVNIPLSSQDFGNVIRGAISGAAVTAGGIASIATGNPAIGVASLAVGAANTGIQAASPNIEHSGHLSGSQGLMDYQTPMLLVTRPHRDKPDKYYSYRGVPAQTTAKLSACSGYTQIADGVSVSAAGATDAELNEITNLLRSGVIF